MVTTAINVTTKLQKIVLDERIWWFYDRASPSCLFVAAFAVADDDDTCSDIGGDCPLH